MAGDMIRGDMIETYKILTGKYDTLVSPTLTTLCPIKKRDTFIFVIFWVGGLA